MRLYSQVVYTNRTKISSVFCCFGLCTVLMQQTSHLLIIDGAHERKEKKKKTALGGEVGVGGAVDLKSNHTAKLSLDLHQKKKQKQPVDCDHLTSFSFSTFFHNIHDTGRENNIPFYIKQAFEKRFLQQVSLLRDEKWSRSQQRDSGSLAAVLHHVDAAPPFTAL